MVQIKKKRSKQSRQEDDIPENLKTFIDSVTIKRELPVAPQPRRSRKAKNVEEEKEDLTLKITKPGQTLTDKEIVELWSTFKVGFPEGKLSKPQIMEVVRKVFPRCDADIVLRNIFRALDADNSGKISPRDLMLTFTMAMTGTIDEKLHWSFKLYDLDDNGEIDIYEMEKIFVSLCTIVEASETDQTKRNRKQEEKATLEERIRQEKQELLKVEKREKELENARYAVKLLSDNFKHREGGGGGSRSQTNSKSGAGGRGARKDGKHREDGPDVRSKVVTAVEMVTELTDPIRDYKKFDYKRRAQELFVALDEDGSGGVSEMEYLKGCKSDRHFVRLLTELSPDFIWGYYKEE